MEWVDTAGLTDDSTKENITATRNMAKVVSHGQTDAVMKDDGLMAKGMAVQNTL